MEPRKKKLSKSNKPQLVVIFGAVIPSMQMQTNKQTKQQKNKQTNKRWTPFFPVYPVLQNNFDLVQVCAQKCPISTLSAKVGLLQKCFFNIYFC